MHFLRSDFCTEFKRQNLISILVKGLEQPFVSCVPLKKPRGKIAFVVSPFHRLDENKTNPVPVMNLTLPVSSVPTLR